MQGEVHDENAFLIGRSFVYAWVFSTSPDLAAFRQMLLNGGVYAHQTCVEAGDNCGIHAAAGVGEKNERTLGWVMHDGRKFERALFLQRTVTGIRDSRGQRSGLSPGPAIVLSCCLTNRVNPTRDNQKIMETAGGA